MGVKGWTALDSASLQSSRSGVGRVEEVHFQSQPQGFKVGNEGVRGWRRQLHGQSQPQGFKLVGKVGVGGTSWVAH